MNYSVQRLFAAFAIALMVALPGVAYATDFDDAAQSSEKVDYAVAGMHFHAANVVTMDEVTDKDLYVAGSTVTIKNEINGDVFAAGQDLTIDGMIKGDLRVAGSVVTINGTVEGNVVAAASTVKVAKDAKINGYLNAYGATVLIDGTVEKAVHVSGEEVVLNGMFNDEVAVEATNTTLEKDAVLAKTMTVTSLNAPTINNDAMKEEKVVFVAEQLRSQPERSMQDQLLETAGSLLYWFVASALIAAVILYLLRGPIMRSVTTLQAKTASAIALGFAVLICLPIAAILVMITIIGAPLGLLALVGYGVLLCLSSIPASIWLGQQLLPAQPDDTFQGAFFQYLAGNIVIMVLAATPFVGWLLSLVAMVAGLGAYVYVLANKAVHKKA